MAVAVAAELQLAAQLVLEELEAVVTVECLQVMDNRGLRTQAAAVAVVEQVVVL
jgi:hypothetical protein